MRNLKILIFAPSYFNCKYTKIESKGLDVMSIKDYRLTSMEEPTDAMLHELMSQVATSARQSSANAKQVLQRKMQETIELIRKQREQLSSISSSIVR